ncbi:MAG: hypothetical protein A2Y53_08170 [Chloroflexi bacterium RBG_16_47_49]|nr:MAG: hypothetical protein A2Y53_08170 [Chloroflexi bacterium RBG_16_47_49]
MGLNYNDLLYCKRKHLWDNNLLSGIFDLISQLQSNHSGLYTDPFRENVLKQFSIELTHRGKQNGP